MNPTSIPHFGTAVDPNIHRAQYSRRLCNASSVQQDRYLSNKWHHSRFVLANKQRETQSGANRLWILVDLYITCCKVGQSWLVPTAQAHLWNMRWQNDSRGTNHLSFWINGDGINFTGSLSIRSVSFFMGFPLFDSTCAGIIISMFKSNIITIIVLFILLSFLRLYHYKSIVVVCA